MKISDIQKRQDLTFVDNDIDFIKDYIGEKSKEFDAFFVKIIDGDFTEIFGIYGAIPYLEKEIYQII